MINELIITSVSVHDTDEILSLDRQCFREPLSYYQYLTYREKKNTRIIKAETDTDIIGAMYYQMMGTICIKRICVHPRYRNLGVARSLVNYLVERLYNQAQSLLEAHVPEPAIQAQLFFKAVGFNGTTTILYPKYENGQTIYCMKYSPRLQRTNHTMITN